MNIEDLTTQASKLRASGHFTEAYQLFLSLANENKELKGLAWEHHPIFWSDIEAGICKLTRRKGSDSTFIEHLWRNQEFIYSFHRNAAEIPSDKRLLEEILEREFISTISESRSLHWIVRDRNSKPWGLLSLTDISLMHKRSEVMLGVMPGAPTGLSTASMLILFNFYFNAIKFNKLCAYIHDDNKHSFKGTLHLGFKEEGRMRMHVMDPKSATYVDLIQLGMLANDAFNPTNKRLMQRLLKR